VSRHIVDSANRVPRSHWSSISLPTGSEAVCTQIHRRGTRDRIEARELYGRAAGLPPDEAAAARLRERLPGGRRLHGVR